MARHAHRQTRTAPCADCGTPGRTERPTTEAYLCRRCYPGDTNYDHADPIELTDGRWVRRSLVYHWEAAA